MKQNDNHLGASVAGLQPVPVHFEFSHPSAKNVSVAGCFNQWQPEAKALHSAGDGRWLPHPRAREYVPNPYGGQNSILKVPSPEAAHLTDAENLPLKM